MNAILEAPDPLLAPDAVEKVLQLSLKIRWPTVAQAVRDIWCFVAVIVGTEIEVPGKTRQEREPLV